MINQSTQMLLKNLQAIRTLVGNIIANYNEFNYLNTQFHQTRELLKNTNAVGVSSKIALICLIVNVWLLSTAFVIPMYALNSGYIFEYIGNADWFLSMAESLGESGLVSLLNGIFFAIGGLSTFLVSLLLMIVLKIFAKVFRNMDHSDKFILIVIYVLLFIALANFSTYLNPLGLVGLVCSVLPVLVFAKSFLSKTHKEIILAKTEEQDRRIAQNQEIDNYNRNLAEKIKEVESRCYAERKILNATIGSWYPEGDIYKEIGVIDFFIRAIQDKKADTMKECVLMYEDDLHKRKMYSLQEDMARNQRIGNFLAGANLVVNMAQVSAINRNTDAQNSPKTVYHNVRIKK